MHVLWHKESKWIEDEKIQMKFILAKKTIETGIKLRKRGDIGK